MVKYINYIIKIILNYKAYSLNIIFYEIFFLLFYDKKYNIINLSKIKSATDPVPTSFYVLKLIESFINKNKIYNICDLGSGRGKILYYLGVNKKMNIDGIEIDNELYSQSLVLKNQNIEINHANILDYDYLKKKYDLLIVNDPFQNKEDLQILLHKLETLKYENFIIFINIDIEKVKIIKNYTKILKFKKFSKSRNVYFTKIQLN